MSDHKGLPVAGYREQTSEKVALVNENKRLEEQVLRQFEAVASECKDHDKRWIAIAKTNIEQGFMALNRSIFKPDRVDLNDTPAA